MTAKCVGEAVALVELAAQNLRNWHQFLWNIENLLCSQFCDEHTLTNIKQVFVLKQIATSISKKIHDKGMRITNNLLSHPQYVSKWDFSMTHVMRG